MFGTGIQIEYKQKVIRFKRLMFYCLTAEPGMWQLTSLTRCLRHRVIRCISLNNWKRRRKGRERGKRTWNSLCPVCHSHMSSLQASQSLQMLCDHTARYTWLIHSRPSGDVTKTSNSNLPLVWFLRPWGHGSHFWNYDWLHWPTAFTTCEPHGHEFQCWVDSDGPHRITCFTGHMHQINAHAAMWRRPFPHKDISVLHGGTWTRWDLKWVRGTTQDTSE